MIKRLGRYARQHHLALLALFLALGGTSFAAAAVVLPANSVGAAQLKKNAVINKKIKNNAVTGAKVANNSLTGADVLESSLGKVQSATNADHATSADSATNATNATNSTNATNATNATTAGNAGQLGGVASTGYQRSTLPSGQTESGNYSVAGSGAGNYMNQGFQFAIPLAASLDSTHVEFHTTGTTSTNCPGVGQAAAGYLCVYEAASGNRNAAAGSPVANHSGFGGADTYGFNVWLGSTSSPAFSYGSWTVQAP